MNLIIEKLNEGHLPMVDVFSCVESEDYLNKLKSKERRYIRKHSQEMDDFLKTEALDEQTKRLNTTHLFIDKDTNRIIAFISLCNDSLKLEIDERSGLEIQYSSVPAVKIARLAVSNNYQHCGIGKMLIQFAAYMTEKISQTSGAAFITLDCYKHRISYYEEIGFVINQHQDITRSYDSPTSMRILLDDYLAAFQ